MAAGGKFADVIFAADVSIAADVTNTALLGTRWPSGPSGPEEKSVQLPSLRSLAAARFLEFVVASIRGEVEPTAAEITQMQVAGAILRELAPLSGPGLDDLDGTIGLSNKRTAPRPRPVDSTLPKGFPGTCDPGNHAITYKPMLLLEIKRGRDKRLASIVSNEAYGAYGSGPISMFTAAQEIRRLLLLGPLTKVAWREVAEDATVLLSASVRYFPYRADDGTIVKSPGCAVHFGSSIKYISFVKEPLALCARAACAPRHCTDPLLAELPPQRQGLVFRAHQDHARHIPACFAALCATRVAAPQGPSQYAGLRQRDGREPAPGPGP